MQDAKAGRGPTHIAVIFDHSDKTFRNDIYKDYKAHRPPAPEELIPQFPLIRDAVQAFNVACIEQRGFEADDLIATYAREAIAKGGDVTIVSSDKDLMQLVQPGIGMLDTMKNKRIGRDEVLEKFGVEPDKVVDVQSLAGDSVDNVPGVPGIGVKTAAELIKEYGDLDTLLARAGEIKQPKRREKLIEFAEQARISRDLVRLKDDVPVEVSVDRLGLQDMHADRLLEFMRQMEFNTLTKRIAEALGVEAPPPLEHSVGSSVREDTASPATRGKPGRPAAIEARQDGSRRRNACGRRRILAHGRPRAEGRSLQVRDGDHARSPASLARRRPRCRPLRLRHRDHGPRCHARRSRRLLARDVAPGQGLLRAARPHLRQQATCSAAAALVPGQMPRARRSRPC